jgi:hypothetical protein
MSARQVHSQLRSQFQTTVDRLNKIPNSEIETQSEYIRFLLVRLSGFVEFTFEAIVREYVMTNSYGRIQSFADSFAGAVGTPNSDRLCQFLNRLDPIWSTSLKQFLELEERKTSLNSLIGLRHLVAHGRPASIGISSFSDYLRVVDDVFAWILDCFEPV